MVKNDGGVYKDTEIMEKETIIARATECLEQEATAIRALVSRLGDAVEREVQAIRA